MKTAAIIYGWAEGPWQGKRFCAQLQKAGFEVIKDSEKADLIVAHSAGCFLVPKQNNAKQVYLIGVPFWPGKPLLVSLAQKLWWEIGHHKNNNDLSWWLNKMSHNILYIFARPWVGFLYVPNRIKLTLPHQSNTRKVFMIRNEADTLCHPDILKLLPRIAGYTSLDLRGGHDDCWSYPKAYIDLISKHL